jgi:hypothetical protein
MSTEDLWNLFYLFLCQKKALTKYIRNRKAYIVGSEFQFESEKEPICFLDSAFVWIDTKEGDVFWRNLRDEWSSLQFQAKREHYDTTRI